VPYAALWTKVPPLITHATEQPTVEARFADVLANFPKDGAAGAPG